MRILPILLFTLSVVEGLALPAHAEPGGPKGLGVGLTLGSPTGITGKYFLTNVHAIDAAIGADDDPDFYVDYLWHGWQAFAQPREGKLAAILGVGGRVESKRHEDKIGIRGVVGAAYYFKDFPVEVTFEVAPVLNFIGGGADLDAGLTLRYYFIRFN